jgi:hypothetical protein
MIKSKYLLYFSVLIALLLSCSKAVNSNSISGVKLSKIVFTRSSADSVVTTFTYNAGGYVVGIMEKGSNMVGLSPTVSNDAIITFQRDALGKVTNYGISYPGLPPVLVTQPNRGTVYYSNNSRRLAYSVGAMGNDSTVYSYNGSVITSFISYYRTTGMPYCKQELTYDGQNNLLTNKYSTWNGSAFVLQESQTITGYDANSNSQLLLSHEESILALRPRYASPYNVSSESYLYSSSGTISYSYTYGSGLPSIATATATGSSYSGTLKFYY